MFVRGYEFDLEFRLLPSHENALRGMLVGAQEAPGTGGAWSVNGDWIVKNMPSVDDLQDVHEAGFVEEHESADGYFSYRLTAHALHWAERHLGLREDLSDDAFETWITEVLTPAFKRRGKRSASSNGVVRVKTCTAIVQLAQYSLPEALAAKAEIDQEVEAGRMSVRSAAAFKAHISRRTQSAA